MPQLKYLLSVALFFCASPLNAQWTLTGGPNGGAVTSFAVCRGFLFAGASADGVFRSRDDGATWTAVTSGLTNTGVWTLAVDDTVLFAGTYGGGVFRSFDCGNTWTAASDGLTDVFVLALVFDGSSLYAGTIGGLFQSTDRGVSWTARDSGLTTLSVRSLAAFGSRLYAGTYGGGIFVSTDKGDSWTGASEGLTNLSILDFAQGGSSVFAGTYGGMFRSTNSGQSWVPMDLTVVTPAADTCARGPLLELNYAGAHPLLPGGTQAPKAVYSLAVSGGDLYVATYGGGVFWSIDDGHTWAGINSGLGDPYLTLITVENLYIYAGTLSGEVWRRRLSEITSAGEEPAGLPQGFRLEQNFPNPFNPSTEIRYAIPRETDVKLAVYDLIGREVSVLANGHRSPGSYTAHLDAAGLSTGVYICRLTAGTFSQTRIMLLIR